MKIAELIKTEKYLNYIQELNRYQNPTVNVDTTEDRLNFLIHIEQNFLNLAQLDCSHIEWVIDNFRLQSIKFIVACDQKFSQLDKQEISQNVEYSAPDLTFPIGHLINFYLIHNNLDLGEYVKKLRIPKTKQYIKDLQEIYTHSMSKKD